VTFEVRRRTILSPENTSQFIVPKKLPKELRVRSIAGDDLIARPHVAQAMVEAGVVATEREAFDRYISDDGIAYVPKHALDPMDALSLIRDAGGACVLGWCLLAAGSRSARARSADE